MEEGRCIDAISYNCQQPYLQAKRTQACSMALLPQRDKKQMRLFCEAHGQPRPRPAQDSSHSTHTSQTYDTLITRRLCCRSAQSASPCVLGHITE